MLTVKLDGVDKALKMFDPKVVGKATRMALNESAKAGKSTATKKIYDRWNLKKADINRKVKTDLARTSNLKAELVVRSESFSLTYFGAKHFHRRGTTTRTKSTIAKRRSRKSGVEVRIMRGGAKTHLPSSFITTLRSGHIGVFRRSGNKRLPIVEKRLISVPTMFRQRDVYRPTLKSIGDTWPRRFDHHLSRLSK